MKGTNQTKETDKTTTKKTNQAKTKKCFSDFHGFCDSQVFDEFHRLSIY